MMPRAIVYHTLGFDLRNFIKTFLNPRSDGSGSNSSKTRMFEVEFASYMSTENAIAFPFARTALYFALKSQVFPPGTEVIMSPLTIKPMVDIVIALDLRPVFVDLDDSTCCFDLRKLREAISPKTKAIFITYLFGLAPDVPAMIDLCKKHGIFVVEDFSQSLNASCHGKKLGTFGDVGIYSCSVTKTLDTYGGGIAVTDNSTIAGYLRTESESMPESTSARLRKKIQKCLIWNIATRRLPFTLLISPLLFMISRLSPKLSLKLMGARLDLKRETQLPDYYFEKFTDLQAEAGLVLLPQVEHLDNIRTRNAQRLHQVMKSINASTTSEVPDSRSIYWQCIAYANNRDTFVKKMKKSGIDTWSTHLSLVCSLDIYPEYKVNCPIAEKIKNNGMYLPVYPRISERYLERIERALSYAWASQVPTTQKMGSLRNSPQSQ